MKKFLLKLLLFLTCVVVMDFVFGLTFSWLRGHAKGGSTANCEYIANRANDDVVILGSSRATHHYVPQIIEDSLGMSCYNCGEEGNGIVLAYGRYKMLTNRYKPKLVIYEITPGYDYGAKDPNSKYLGYLRPYYRLDGIKEIFDDFDSSFSSLKMSFAMYRNTSRLFPNVIDNIIQRDNHKGFAPLYGKIDISSITKEKETLVIDSLKLLYLERIIIDAQKSDIPIVFIISPAYGGVNDISIFDPALQMCAKHGILVLNYLNYSKIATNAIYFNDILHMNESGAIEYTQVVINDLLNNTNLIDERL